MNKKTSVVYELWYSKSQNSYAFFPKGDQSNMNLLEPDAELIWQVLAESWEEAISKQHEYLGWDAYKPEGK